MKIQSLSIVVPNQNCVNNCPCCVSKMHCNDYENLMKNTNPDFGLHLKDYLKRLDFARDNGCNTIMLTGTSEPQQNRNFLTWFGMMMQMMQRPFRWIEMQTTGVLLDYDYLKFLRGHVGINLISLSLFSLDGYTNAEIIGCHDKFSMPLDELCKAIKICGFGLRFSLNLTREFEQYAEHPEALFETCKNMGADQVTLRVLYTSNENTPQDKWIHENGLPLWATIKLKDYIREHGRVLSVLPHGATRYELHDLSVVLDDDCMDKTKKNDENFKYLILQPNCRLYSQWDSQASMIF